MKLSCNLNFEWRSVAPTHPASFHNVLLQVSRSCHQHVDGLERKEQSRRNKKSEKESRVHRNVLKVDRLLTFIRSEQDPRILRWDRKNITGKKMKERSSKNEQFYTVFVLLLVDLQLYATSVSPRLTQNLLRNKNWNRDVEQHQA